MGKPYKTSELEIIKENYHVIPAKQIAEKLNRTEAGIHSRAFILGISRKRKMRAGRTVDWDIKQMKENRNGEKMDHE